MRKVNAEKIRFIPKEKLSKRKRRELATSQRGNWGGINPVTRMPPNSKAYRRHKEKQAYRKENDLWA